jgi:hypothetical protein
MERTPCIFNLRMTPYAHAQITSNTYHDWMFQHGNLLVPPRQKAGSFSLDQVIAKMIEASSGTGHW